MYPPLYITESQQRQDTEHLKMLSIFHFVVGGLALLGVAFLILHCAVMGVALSHSEVWNAKQGSGPPAKFLGLMLGVYLFMTLVVAAIGIANVLSGIFLLRRKHRTFSIVVAGVNCLQIPLGTILGVFTIMVLSRESVRRTYGT